MWRREREAFKKFLTNPQKEKKAAERSTIKTPFWTRSFSNGRRHAFPRNRACLGKNWRAGGGPTYLSTIRRAFYLEEGD